MCGIVGYMTGEVNRGFVQRDKFIQQALVMGTLRGQDSTGIFGSLVESGPGDSIGWVKSVDDGLRFLYNEEVVKFLDAANHYKYCVGHNRAATVGKITTDNAHPFQEGPITMVHNGSLWSTAGLPQSQRELKVDVDSHAICHNLAIASPEDVIPELDGAFALVWHDSRDDTLHIVRNNERPFHMAQVTGEDTIVFMSEAAMLRAVTSRISGMSIGPIAYPKVGQWLTFSVEDLNNPVVKDLDLSSRRVYSYGNSGRAASYDPWEWLRREEEKEQPKLPAPRYDDAKDQNMVKVGGRRRDVPTRAQEMLVEHDLLVEHRLPFVPHSASRPIAGKCVVSGYLTNTGMTGIVYNVNPEVFDAAKDRVWTIRPIAIKYLDEKEPSVVCRVTSTHNSTTPPPKEEKAASFVKGPKDNYIPVTTFVEMTSGGCTHCGKAISYYDAEDVEWINNYIDPLCPVCTHELCGYFHGELH